MSNFNFQGEERSNCLCFICSRQDRARCAYRKKIRAVSRAFAIAIVRGLDVKDEPAMSRAFGRALGRQIESPDEMNGDDWQAVGDMMKRGALAW